MLVLCAQGAQENGDGDGGLAQQNARHQQHESHSRNPAGIHPRYLSQRFLWLIFFGSVTLIFVSLISIFIWHYSRVYAGCVVFDVAVDTFLTI